MYAVPARAETCGATERIIGNWLARNRGLRHQLVIASKVAGPSRAIGLSNETPYGVYEFVRLAEQHGLPRIATVQNGLDETLHRLGVPLLACSPLGFGLLSGKYDASGFDGPAAPQDAARRYNQLARDPAGPAAAGGKIGAVRPEPLSFLALELFPLAAAEPTTQLGEIS